MNTVSSFKIKKIKYHWKIKKINKNIYLNLYKFIEWKAIRAFEVFIEGPNNTLIKNITIGMKNYNITFKE